MAQETSISTKNSPRTVITTKRLTGQKLRVSKAEKWARHSRLKIEGPYRFVFDVESNWRFRKSSVAIKAAHANELSMRVYKGPPEEWVKITPVLYKEVNELIRDDKQLCLALAIMISVSFVGQNYEEALELAWKKAKKHEDPNKVLGVIKFSLQFLEHMEHLKGLHKGVNKGNGKNNPEDNGIVDAELIDPV
ncbi:MAG TPA: hypothetical protein ENI23_09430 [bacterium]|nr:hypothetical protein [bacterium]